MIIRGNSICPNTNWRPSRNLNDAFVIRTGARTKRKLEWMDPEETRNHRIRNEYAKIAGTYKKRWSIRRSGAKKAARCGHDRLGARCARASELKGNNTEYQNFPTSLY